MLSFKQFITEVWHSTASEPRSWSKEHTFDVYKNPSRHELSKLVNGSEAKTVRGITHNNDVYVFDAMHAIHYQGRDHLKKHGIDLTATNSHDFHVGIEHRKSPSPYYVASESPSEQRIQAITNHPWVNKTLPGTRIYSS